MLYASQWFLTAFACPFPTTFASRVIDVMLAEHQGGMLMRVALAVMAECEAEIVELDDFEDIITHLKARPRPCRPPCCNTAGRAHEQSPAGGSDTFLGGVYAMPRVAPGRIWRSLSLT